MSLQLRRTTHFTEPSNELGELEDLWRLCVAHLFFSSSLLPFFPLNPFYLLSPVQHAQPQQAEGLQPTPSRQSFMNCWFMSLFLHCRTPGFESDFWKRAHWLENQFDSSRKSRSEVPATTGWVNQFKEGFRFSLGRILLCHCDCFKCAAIADYSLLLCKSFSAVQTGCLHLVSASIKVCTLAKVISDK